MCNTENSYLMLISRGCSWVSIKKEGAVNLEIAKPGAVLCEKGGGCSFAVGTQPQRVSAPLGFTPPPSSNAPSIDTPRKNSTTSSCTNNNNNTTNRQTDKSIFPKSAARAVGMQRLHRSIDVEFTCHKCLRT